MAFLKAYKGFRPEGRNSNSNNLFFTLSKVQRIIPSINRKLAPKFIRVIPVDLRWGVLADESKNCEEIQKTCLNQIDKCRENVLYMPWFLGLRTERYGWVQDNYLSYDSFEQPK